MNKLGKITTGLLVVVAVGAAVAVVLSLPDIRRYREIRAMLAPRAEGRSDDRYTGCAPGGGAAERAGADEITGHRLR